MKSILTPPPSQWFQGCLVLEGLGLHAGTDLVAEEANVFAARLSSSPVLRLTPSLAFLSHGGAGKGLSLKWVPLPKLRREDLRVKQLPRPPLLDGRPGLASKRDNKVRIGVRQAS